MSTLAINEEEEDALLMDPVSFEPLHNATLQYPNGQPIYTMCSMYI